ncbi:MAG: ParB/RepB/Spo0J family partition protein [Firmicutes bacterium]|nr:ParB/RepB/Spo0J family partition protein [Alicyclobacillaceae bacterium]MCL6496128.1 ParB/RepB/Spo0J family partition protein [Bacillota bacterium]
MGRPRGLGRGLSALIPPPAGTEAGAGVQEIPVDRIAPNPFQPRRRFDAGRMEELVESVRRHGILQPVVVRRTGDGFQLVSGERRWRAAQLAGMEAVPAVIRECDDRAMAELALVENLQREDLNPMEEAEAYHRLIQEFGWTQEALAERVGRSRPHVANMIRLLQLEPEIRQWIADGQLTAAHGKALLAVAGARRVALAGEAVRRGWTVSELSRRLAERGGRDRAKTEDVHLESAAEALRRRLGVPVRIRPRGEGGRVEVWYRNLEELERILETLEGEPEVGPEFVV